MKIISHAYAIIFLLVFLSSCRSFDWFKKKYQTRVDTTTVYIPYEVVVKKDSVVFQTVNPGRDTVIIERQGRSTLRIERYRDTVRLKCDCDSVTVRGVAEKKVALVPVFQEPLRWWHWAIYAGLGALVLFLLYLITIKTYHKNIEKK